MFLLDENLSVCNVRLHVLQSSSRIDLSLYSCVAVRRNEAVLSGTTFHIKIISISC